MHGREQRRLRQRWARNGGFGVHKPDPAKKCHVFCVFSSLPRVSAKCAPPTADVQEDGAAVVSGQTHTYYHHSRATPIVSRYENVVVVQGRSMITKQAHACMHVNVHVFTGTHQKYTTTRCARTFWSHTAQTLELHGEAREMFRRGQ